MTQADINKTRQRYDEVLLYDRLTAAIRRLNPALDEDGVKDAVSQLAEDGYLHHFPPVETNEKIRAKMVSLSQTGGLDPVTVVQDSDDGPEHVWVKVFDFENPENNDFVMTNQFRVQGFKNPIFPDIVLFVNGIPLVILECKDPAIPRPIEQAYEKNLGPYQDARRGFARLFFYNHCMIATCGTLARVGTLQSDINHYARWSDPYPLTEKQVKDMCDGRGWEQEMTIAGLLSKRNLLDHLQNFVTYETVNGKRIKKVAKHQQYRAVTKSIKRLREGESVKGRGGVVWHTQGSGKSLSMMWFASQLRYKIGNPPIVIVTDRKQLDKQIHETFKSCGFPAPIRAKNARHLQELLTSPKGRTIMTIIDKFATDTQIRTDEKVICLVDEAHRSHYKMQAEQMRVAMPNAVFFGFTGTPIDKEDRSTYKVFGPMLDKYGFSESQADGSTLPIMYQGRLPNLFVEGDDTLEQLFERTIGQDPDMTPELKESLKNQYVTKEKIAEAPSRIKRVALDIVNHYTMHAEPNGYKAMLVAPSREAAVTYKMELDGMNAPKSKIIMTSSLGETGKDGHNWDEYFLTPEQRESESERFKNPDDPTKILIVIDMLLVGYDVPVCQVLYLDRGLREHNLLQAIARVNRPHGEAKTHGLIVDYSGVTRQMQKALEMFEEQDVDGALKPLDGLLHELRLRHLDVMSYFKGVRRDNYDQIIERFEHADMRERFEYVFKRFSKALDAVLPGKEAEPYVADFKFAGEARQLVRTRYDGVNPSLRSYAKKIQKLIDDHVRSLPISIIINNMEVTHENFLAFVSKTTKSDRAKSALIRTRAIAIIDELKPYNPALYESLRQRLQRLIDEEVQRRKENADYFTNPEKYEEIYNLTLSEEKKRREVFGDYDATPFEFALYGEIRRTQEQQQSIDLTKEIFSKMQGETTIVDWKNKTSVEKKIRRVLYETMSAAGFNDAMIEELSDKAITLARNNL